jgi:hypothetical protein
MGFDGFPDDWKPIPTKGSKGEKVLARKLADRRQNPGRSKRPSREKNIERRSSEEMETTNGEDTVMEEDAQNPSPNLATSKRRKKFHWPAGIRKIREILSRTLGRT